MYIGIIAPTLERKHSPTKQRFELYHHVNTLNACRQPDREQNKECALIACYFNEVTILIPFKTFLVPVHSATLVYMFCILYWNKINIKKKLQAKKNLWKPDFFADPQARRCGPQGVRGPQFENHCHREPQVSCG